MYRLEDELFVDRPRDRVFSFFSDAQNLEQVTPPELRFEILAPLPVNMQAGTLIDYRIRIRGVPLRWQSKITLWEPPWRFRDEQTRGPYAHWVHTHEFMEHAGGTRMKDVVEYAPPGGPLAPLVHWLFVQREVERVFRYRHERFAEILPMV